MVPFTTLRIPFCSHLSSSAFGIFIRVISALLLFTRFEFFCSSFAYRPCPLSANGAISISSSTHFPVSDRTRSSSAHCAFFLDSNFAHGAISLGSTFAAHCAISLGASFAARCAISLGLRFTAHCAISPGSRLTYRVSNFLAHRAFLFYLRCSALCAISLGQRPRFSVTDRACPLFEHLVFFSNEVALHLRQMDCASLLNLSRPVANRALCLIVPCTYQFLSHCV